MLNKKVLKYIDYQLGERVNNKFIYGGIYKDNILLIEMNDYQSSFVEYFYTKSTTKIKIDTRIPTINELRYIINSYTNCLKSMMNLTYTSINICEFITVDSIYYKPNIMRYIIYIKRIPIK
jgi:hypothetical protein